MTQPDTRPRKCGAHERTQAVGMIEYVTLTGPYRFSGLCRACLPRAKASRTLAAHGHIVHGYGGQP